MPARSRGLLLALALSCVPASALRAHGSPRYFGCSLAPLPELECSAVDGAEAKRAKSRAERSGIIIFEDDGTQIIIHGWAGRMGNQLRFLALGIMMAESFGYTAVALPSTSDIVIADLPRRLVVDKRDVDFYCWGKNPRCSDLKASEWRRVLARYVWPLLTERARSACALDDGFQGLTVHLRSGDLMWHTGHSETGFAPCAFFSDVIWSGGYHDVRIVTEKDMTHPCVKTLPLQHPGVKFTVQSKSVVEDFCTLVRSRNVAVGAPFSTFADFAKLLSHSLRQSYTPRDCDCTGSVKPGNATERCYSIHGMGKARTEEEKKEYLESTPRSAVRQRNMCPLDQTKYKK